MLKTTLKNKSMITLSILISIVIMGYALDVPSHIKNLFFSDAIAKSRDLDYDNISTHDFSVKVSNINDIAIEKTLNVHWLGQNWLGANQEKKPAPPIIIGIHGTPGSWSAWQAVMETQWVKENTQFIAVDRPGWGASKVILDEKPIVISDIGQQANIIAHLIQDIKQQQPSTPIVLLGHSWGGPVIAQIAADNNSLIDGLVVLGGAFEPLTMKPRWYHKAAKNRIIGTIIGKGLRLSNLEMLPLSHQLAMLENRWQDITVPTIIIQGESDYLVDASNGSFFNDRLINSPSTLLLLPNKGHFIPFNEPEIVIDALKSIIQSINKTVNGDDNV